LTKKEEIDLSKAKAKQSCRNRKKMCAASKRRLRDIRMLSLWIRLHVKAVALEMKPHAVRRACQLIL